jgi:hypothetical protein
MDPVGVVCEAGQYQVSIVPPLVAAVSHVHGPDLAQMNIASKVEYIGIAVLEQRLSMFVILDLFW